MVVSIANLVIDINLIYEDEFKPLKDYIISGEPEFYINSSFDEFKLELSNPFMETEFFDKYLVDGKIIQAQKNTNDLYYAYIVYDGKRIDIYNDKNNKFQDEYLLSQYAIFSLIDDYTSSIIFHSSTFKYGDYGVALSAKSGTGKSTHRRLWQKYGDITPINDDKNIITLIDNKLYITPNPWCGKHFVQHNITAPLSVIVFLYQSKINEIKEISKAQAFKLLLGQIIGPNDKNKDKWNKIVDKLLELPILYYGCNMEMDAYTTLKERIDQIVK